MPPPEAPHYATELNGVSLPDACFNNSDGPHHVFVIGDWGGVLGDRGDRPVPADRRSRHMPSHHRPFILGADDRAQQNVAEQMRRRSAVHEPDYVLNMGDNFYWGGVLVKCGGPAFGVEDASGQWEWVFERVYDFKGLEGKQWLGVLGNHDYGGFMFTHGWDQAIGYTWTKGHPSRGRWVTPAQYWSAKVHYPDFSVDYYFVDSNPWDASEPHADPEHNLCSRKHNLQRGATCGAQGPVSVEECPAWFDRLWEAQVAWLDKGLTASKADWQIIVTHFPPEHGLMDWKRLTSEHGVDLLVSGHRHQQEVHHLEEGNFLRPTAYIVSGGGGGITSEGLPDASGHDDQYGFMDLTLTRREIRIEAISHGGHLRSTTCLRQISRDGKLAPEVDSAHSLCNERHSSAQPDGGDHVGQAERYNCKLGLSNWQMLWSFAKGTWCCEHKHVCMGAFGKDGASRHESGEVPAGQGSSEGTGGGSPTAWSGGSGPSSASAPAGAQEAQKAGGPPQEGPAVLLPVDAPAATPSPGDEGSSFDCLSGYYNLDTEWSQEKRFWCCAHEKLGCNHLYNCNPDDVSNPMTSWSLDKFQFCCDAYAVGCLSTQAPEAEVAPEALFNCNPDRPGNSLARWSEEQVEYCCNNFQIGCDAPGSPESTEEVPAARAAPAEAAPAPAEVQPAEAAAETGERFDCEADLLDWELMWSVAKQEWCCRHKGLGCTHIEDCDYDGGDNQYETWSLSKREWCCMHWGVGCEEEAPSSPAGPKQLWARGPHLSPGSWRPSLSGSLRCFPLFCAIAGVAVAVALAVAARKAGRRRLETVRGFRINFATDDCEEELLTME